MLLTSAYVFYMSTLTDSFNHKHLFDVFPHSVRFDGRRITSYRNAIGCDEKLGEIPFDVVAEDVLASVFEKLKDRVGVLAVDINLLHHLECHAVVDLTEVRNLLIASRVLTRKLIARKSYHYESFIFISLV